MSKLFRRVCAFRSKTSEKLWSEILFKFQWHTKKFSQEFDSSTGLSSMSSLKLMCRLEMRNEPFFDKLLLFQKLNLQVLRN